MRRSQRDRQVNRKVFKLHRDAGDIPCSITLWSAGVVSLQSAGPTTAKVRFWVREVRDQGTRRSQRSTERSRRDEMVTSRITISWILSIPGMGGWRAIGLDLIRLTTISLDLEWFNLRLLMYVHVEIRSSSERVLSMQDITHKSYTGSRLLVLNSISSSLSPNLNLALPPAISLTLCTNQCLQHLLVLCALLIV